MPNRPLTPQQYDDPFEALHAKLDLIREDLNKPPEFGHPGGMKARLNEIERWRGQVERFTRWGSGIVAVVVAAVVGAWALLGLGPHQPPPGH